MKQTKKKLRSKSQDEKQYEEGNAVCVLFLYAIVNVEIFVIKMLMNGKCESNVR